MRFNITLLVLFTLYLSVNVLPVNAATSSIPALQLLLLDDEHGPECTVPVDYLSGFYRLEQIDGNVDPFYASKTFGNSQIVNITANGLNRSFPFFYYLEEPIVRIYNFEITLTCGGEIHVNGSIAEGQDILSCSDHPISFGFTTGVPVSTYAVSEINDDIVLVNVTDHDPDGGCGTGSYQVELRLTEIM